MLQLVYLLKRCHFLASQSSSAASPAAHENSAPFEAVAGSPTLPSTVRVMRAIQTLSAHRLVRLERREDWVAPDERAFGADA